MNHKYKYLGKNTIIFAISSFGTKALSFLLLPLYTSILTTTEYGTADLITTTATLLMFILSINISSSVLRFTLEQRENGSNILSYGFRILLIGTLTCCLILGIFAYLNLFKWPLLFYIFILFYFFALVLYEIMTNYLRAIDKVREVAIAGVLSSFLIIVCNIFFLLIFKIGLIGYILSLVIGPLLASFYCIYTAKEPIATYTIVECPKELKRDMLEYCIPLIFNNVALWINAFLDRFFITFYCGVSENGIYSVAGKIPTILATCYSVFAGAWTISAIKEFDSKDSDGFFSKTYNYYGALMTTFCSCIIIINIPLAKLLYSNDFFVAWKYSSVLLISVMFNTLTVFQGSIFSAAKATRAVATTTIISAVVNIIMNILLIPHMGALGAAIATAIAYFTMWFARFILAKKLISMTVSFAKDIVVYLTIVLQVIFEHFENHFYFGQLLCFGLIVFFNRKYINTFIEVIVRKIKHEKSS